MTAFLFTDFFLGQLNPLLKIVDLLVSLPRPKVKSLRGEKYIFRSHLRQITILARIILPYSRKASEDLTDDVILQRS